MYMIATFFKYLFTVQSSYLRAWVTIFLTFGRLGRLIRGSKRSRISINALSF